MPDTDKIQHIPLDKIRRSPFQPRTVFDETYLNELADSLLEQGQIQPAVVRPVDDAYELIGGECRWRACGLAGIVTLECKVIHVSDEAAAELALIDNIQRKNLNAIDEACALQKLKDEHGHTQETLSKKISRPRSLIANTLRLLNLTNRIQSHIRAGALSAAHGRTLAALPHHEQEKAARIALERSYSVRQLEALIKRDKAAEGQPESDRSDLKRLSRLISEQTGLDAQLSHSKTSGTLQFNYKGLDTLQGLLDKLGVKYDD